MILIFYYVFIIYLRYERSKRVKVLQALYRVRANFTATKVICFLRTEHFLPLYCSRISLIVCHCELYLDALKWHFYNHPFLHVTKKNFDFFLVLILNIVKITELLKPSKHSSRSNQAFTPKCSVANN